MISQVIEVDKLEFGSSVGGFREYGDKIKNEILVAQYTY